MRGNQSTPGPSVLVRSMVPKMPEHRRARGRATGATSWENGRATEAPETSMNDWEANENGSGRSTWRSDKDWEGVGGGVAVEGKENGVS